MSSPEDGGAPAQTVCRAAAAGDFPAVQQMLELYQYELSDLWPQDLDAQGRYGYDLRRHLRAQRFFAHVVWHQGVYAGCALVAPAAVTRTEGCWMEQFFVLKRYRRCGVGRALAQHVFAAHPGPWEVGQMPGNAAALAFWRRVIADHSPTGFTEQQVTDGWWRGTVQRFDAPPAPPR
ncbi:GNAT family N-acetyltransferase [Ideonella sp. 4Y11]|uniref:GNAT family N-acetyltransferase n=1 Tax=Ideonella aquatica TaxID=2824119 RepID=A0A940YQ68_9BURK|nr:GNAT family N-acetyltransferase [Ideonella aquatica]MBQ0960937.1 GNAT family N-acetyltransferase [Ideonella aquatica]